MDAENKGLKDENKDWSIKIKVKTNEFEENRETMTLKLSYLEKENLNLNESLVNMRSKYETLRDSESPVKEVQELKPVAMNVRDSLISILAIKY